MVYVEKRCLLVCLLPLFAPLASFGDDQNLHGSFRFRHAVTVFDGVADREPGDESFGRRLPSKFTAFTPGNCRLPGEFEHQSALLVACHELISTAPELLVQLVVAVRGRVNIVALVSDAYEYETVARLLRMNAVSPQNVQIVELVHDTMWARDYGPIIVKSNSGRPIVIDADYDLDRANDDRVPDLLARMFGADFVRVPLRIDGGNLVSNGAGLAMTTHRLVDENVAEADMDTMCDIVARGYGLNQLVILEPLLGETTGHVDMFATFTSENTVVVGMYDPETDPENAAILDRNAAELARVRMSKRRLRVVRIPMPSHEDGVWRTYTNVVFANGVLLVPTYVDVDWAAQSHALTTYAKLMPDWNVVGIDASRIIESNGALHCITMNLGPLGELTNPPLPQTHRLDANDLIIHGNAPTAQYFSDNSTTSLVRTSAKVRLGHRTRVLSPPLINRN